MDKDDIIQTIFEIVIFIVVAMVMYFIFEPKSFKVPQKEIQSKPIIISDTFSQDLLMEELKINKIKHTDIVYAQARLETGNFKSEYFKKRHNLFGFRVKSGYMYFSNWKECVKYYANWQNKYYKKGDYFEFLKKIGYAEDSTYIQKVKLCIK